MSRPGLVMAPLLAMALFSCRVGVINDNHRDRDASQCTPFCEGLPCGSDDGCQGSCQQGSGCICVPFCDGLPCGSADGCGGVCRPGSGGGTGEGCHCTLECEGKLCDVDDGCGNVCEPGSGCCEPSCLWATCGEDDGCGNLCQPGSGCCEPSCQGRPCGIDNGCGGVCVLGSGCTCVPGCEGKVCGVDDGCGNLCEPGSGCCTPSCSDKLCGADDGCGNPCQAGSGCCTPSCSGKCGGPDGCGGTCPSTCPSTQTCQGPEYTTCVDDCTPSCSGKVCGADDGCGGICQAGSGCVVSEATIIYPYSGLGWYSHIAVSSPSRVMLVWAERSNFRGIMYSCFNGTSWTSPQRVEPANNELQDDPSLVAGSDGVFHLVFSHAQGTGRHIKYARFEGACSQAWTASQVVSNSESLGTSSVYPSIGVDENGRPQVTWSQAVTTDGQGEYEQHYSRRDPGGWINPSMRITPANLDVGHNHRLAHHGRVYVENSTNVHAIFLLPIGHLGDRSQYYSHFNGTSWSMPEDTGVDGHFGDVRVDADRIHVFSCYGEYRSRLRTGGSWQNYAKLLSDWQAGKMALRMDGSGRLHAAWTDYNRVYYAVKDPHPASWQTSKRVSTNTGTHSSPTLDIDSDGYAHIAWHECENCGTSEYGAILYRKVRYQDL